jgi:hypothetical protein
MLRSNPAFNVLNTRELRSIFSEKCYKAILLKMAIMGERRVNPPPFHKSYRRILVTEGIRRQRFEFAI